MKKILSAIAISAVLTGCGATTAPEDTTVQDEPAQPIHELTDTSEVNIDVPSCDDQVADLKAQYPDLDNQEIYRVASKNLLLGEKEDEAVACCEQLEEETAIQKCKADIGLQ